MSVALAPTPTPAVPLTSLGRGQTAVICESRLDPDDAAILRAMGLGNKVRIRLCRVGEPVVVALGTTEGRHCHCHGHCRIGLARDLAERLFVVADANGAGSERDSHPDRPGKG